MTNPDIQLDTLGENDLVFLHYTSGIASSPKGVLTSQKATCSTPTALFRHSTPLQMTVSSSQRPCFVAWDTPYVSLSLWSQGPEYICPIPTRHGLRVFRIPRLEIQHLLPGHLPLSMAWSNLWSNHQLRCHCPSYAGVCSRDHPHLRLSVLRLRSCLVSLSSSSLLGSWRNEGV